MQIQINTDKNIVGDDTLTRKIEALIEQGLRRFSSQITRVEAHLSDENSAVKSSTDDKRCMLEVRVSGRQPISATEQAGTIEQAALGAAQKMIHALESTFGKLGER